MKAYLAAAVALTIVCMFMSQSASATVEQDLADWKAGDEKALLGHGFDETMWDTDLEKLNDNGDTVTTSISYLNYEDSFQVCMLALNKVQNANGTGVLPYQMLAMHYTTPEGQDVFIGATLAFFLAYNDTNGNGLPEWSDTNTSANPLFIIPFGVNGNLNKLFPNFSAAQNAPVVTHEPMERVAEGHYRCGMHYTNMWAIATQSLLASAILKTAWLVKFSEMGVTYDIKIDAASGTVSVETFYTIGQVTELWAVWLGIPIKVDDAKIHTFLTPDWGLAAVHYATVFTSKDTVSENATASKFSTNVKDPTTLSGDLEWKNNGNRFFKAGVRGAYDVIDEDTDTKKVDAQDALAVLMPAKRMDGLLVLWQLGVSIPPMAVFAYGLSKWVQGNYSSPMDLVKRSLNPLNPQGFMAAPLWYGTAFPHWQGYRIEHDPVYTIFVDMGTQPPVKDDTKDKGCGSTIVAGAVAAVAIPFAVIRRKKG